MQIFQKAWVVYVALITVIIATSIMTAKIYVPFKNVVNIEKMLENESKVELRNLALDEVKTINSDYFKIALHNVFNDIEISRKLSPYKDKETKDAYNIKLEYTKSNNEKVEYSISIYKDPYININGYMYKASSNVYSKIEDISSNL